MDNTDQPVVTRVIRASRRVRPRPRWIVAFSAAAAVLAVTFSASPAPGPRAGNRVPAHPQRAGSGLAGPVGAVRAEVRNPTATGSPPGAELDARVAEMAGLEATSATNTIWSGYVATGGPFTSVAASWTQATLRCGPTDKTQSAFWVGLDGYGTQTIEQVGTEANCGVIFAGRAQYSAVYQAVPNDSTPEFFNESIQPGDAMSASVIYEPDGMFSLTLIDHTQGWTQTANVAQPGAQLSTAEVIVENQGGGASPLSEFGTVPFTDATVDNNPIGDSGNLTSLTMTSASGTVMAAPSPLTGGKAFNVCSSASPCPAPQAPVTQANPDAKVLFICSDLPNVTSAWVLGYNQFPSDFESKIWSLDQPWQDYDGHNWNCAWTQTDVDWLWSPKHNGTTDTPIIYAQDANQKPVSSVQPFHGSDGWYDNSYTYYVCFIDQPGQTSC